MSHWNTLSSDDILREWKEFRKGLCRETAIEDIATHFCDVPLGARCIDYYSPETWLSPWEILYHRAFCRSNTALLMYYTLRFVEFSNYAAELALINDSVDIYLVLLINKQYILNYDLGKVAPFPEVAQTIKIIEIFDNQRIKQYE